LVKQYFRLFSFRFENKNSIDRVGPWCQNRHATRKLGNLNYR
jgi:hypothetical protein